MKIANEFNYNDCFSKIEELYICEEYFQIVEIKESNYEVDFLDQERDHYSEFAEVFAFSYIKLNNFKSALVIIDNHLKYLSDNRISNKEYFDDITTFFLMRIEIFEKKNSKLNQLKSVLHYVSLGGKDRQILDLQIKLENSLFLKYVKFNKVVLYILLITIILSVVSNLKINESVLNIITILVLIWYFLNYFYYRKAKKLFVKTIRKVF